MTRTRWVALALLLGLGACGSESEDGGGMAGAPAAPRGVGEVCTDTAQCISGTICGRAQLAGQCTTGCPSDASCLTVQAGTRCVGAPNGECGLPCADDTQCPVGTTCVLVAGTMACKAP